MKKKEAEKIKSKTPPPHRDFKSETTEAKIIIDKESYTETSPGILEQMLAEIKKLPEPQITPHDMIMLEPQEMVLCLQNETAYVYAKNMRHPIRYIGTKYLFSCILVYLHSDVDHLVIHCGPSRPHIKLTDLLAQFVNKKNIQAVLIGGTTTEGNQNTVKILKLILEQIVEASKALNLTITITQQKLMAANQFTEDNRPAFIFDHIINRASIISRKYYHHPIDLSRLSDLTLQDLQKNSSFDLTLMTERELQLTITFLKTAVEFNTQLDAHLNTIFLTLFKDESTFYATLRRFFSLEGSQLINSLFPTRKSSLSNFVFDIHSGAVIPISRNMFTPDEPLRFIRMQLNTPSSDPYFSCYMNRYNKPLDTADIQDFLQLVIPKIKNFSEEDFKALFPQTPEYGLNMIARFIKQHRGIKGYEEEKSPLKQGFFRIPRTIPEFYCEDKVVNTNLYLLNKMTGLKFVGMIRRYPEWTMDAILPCTSELEGAKHILALAKINIPCKLITFSTGERFLCIQAINVKAHSQKICDTITAHPIIASELASEAIYNVGVIYSKSTGYPIIN